MCVRVSKFRGGRDLAHESRADLPEVSLQLLDLVAWRLVVHVIP